MYRTIETPPFLSGTPEEQLEQLRRYLILLVEALNLNLESIGGNDLTDKERAAMQGVIQTEAGNLNDNRSLRELIIETVEYFKKQLSSIEKVPLSAEVANGHFEQYVKQVNFGIPSDLSGHQKNEQLLTVLQKLKLDDLGVRNYVYAGKLRTVGGTDVYGVAIGQDVVTFAQDGTETFNPENAVMEITAQGIRGTILPASTTETDMDNLTDPGTYWLTMGNMTHGPSDLSAKHEVQVTGNGTLVNQRIYGNLSIYFRNYDGVSWNSWRKLEGTI